MCGKWSTCTLWFKHHCCMLGTPTALQEFQRLLSTHHLVLDRYYMRTMGSFWVSPQSSKSFFPFRTEVFTSLWKVKSCCNLKEYGKIKVFFIISSKFRIISKAMQSFGAYPALNSLIVSQSQIAWQVFRPYRHCTDEETDTGPLWSSYLFDFCPFYIIIVYTHRHTRCISRSKCPCHFSLCLSPCIEHRGSQQQRLWVNSVSISMSIRYKPSRKGWASWQQIRVKGLSSRGRQSVTTVPGLSVRLGSLKHLAEQSKFGCEWD